MPREEKPIPYERRILDTKGLAQRLDLNYLKRPHWLRKAKRMLGFLLPLAAAAAAIPFVAGWGGGKAVFTAGPVSRAHAIFERDCTSCHTTSFSKVADADCKRCHDGPVHHANANRQPRCAECHFEHRGNFMLAEVADANCTACHSDLSRQGQGVHLQSASLTVTKFQLGRHPGFSAETRPDMRPLKLNHAAHIPVNERVIRGMRLPMKCQDCHEMAPRLSGFDMLPVTFERHCKSCHARELEFDIYGVLAPQTPPVPHNKDPRSMRDYVRAAYEDALHRDPSLARRPLPATVGTVNSPAAWLDKVTAGSVNFLFDRKCEYCHEVASKQGMYPVVRPVHQLSGRYVKDKVEGEPWFQHAAYSHRTHRMLECVSCHSQAPASVKTSDVLIPKMEACTPCHAQSGTALDHCAQCHNYHDKTREQERERRSVEDLVRTFRQLRR